MEKNTVNKSGIIRIYNDKRDTVELELNQALIDFYKQFENPLKGQDIKKNYDRLIISNEKTKDCIRDFNKISSRNGPNPWLHGYLFCFDICSVHQFNSARRKLRLIRAGVLEVRPCDFYPQYPLSFKFRITKKGMKLAEQL